MTKEQLIEIAKAKYDADSVTGYWRLQGFLDALKEMFK